MNLLTREPTIAERTPLQTWCPGHAWHESSDSVPVQRLIRNCHRFSGSEEDCSAQARHETNHRILSRLDECPRS